MHTLHIINSFKCLELVFNFEQVLGSKMWYFQPINRGNSNLKRTHFFLNFVEEKNYPLYSEYNYHRVFLLFIIFDYFVNYFISSSFYLS